VNGKAERGLGGEPLEVAIEGIRPLPPRPHALTF
jgi:hypothetical protein